VSTVLVTGGTGTLGRPLVAELRSAGQDVRVLSRKPGEGHVVGNLADGTGVRAALDGADVVVHAATSPRMRAVDVRGSERLIAAARDAGVAHVVYVSIVGVDRNPMPYYTVKRAVEQAVVASGLPFTLARGTQFYDLVDAVLGKLHLGPVPFAPKGWRFEPHAPAEFAASLARRVAAGPSGGVTEFGGPAVYDAARLAADVHRDRGRTGRVRQLPVPGRTSAAFAAGAQVSGPGAEHGTTTWEQWRAARA
jgi:uncharacterized protein YbjT (DUF2867 family)